MRQERITRKKRRLKPRAIFRIALVIGIPVALIIAIIAIIVVAVSNIGKTSAGVAIVSSDEVNSLPIVVELKEPAVPFTEQIDGVWNLRLVSPAAPLSGELDIQTEPISYRYAREGMSFDIRAVDALSAMCVAADLDGVNLYVISSYRTYADQSALYDAEVAEWIAAGYPADEARIHAATEVAAPGTSEHQVGLAVDFNSVEQSFENTAEFAWLSEHAEEYGFIMRYPENKQDITGVIYEPWHYRYVGRMYAAKINALGLCLEEYLEAEK